MADGMVWLVFVLHTTMADGPPAPPPLCPVRRVMFVVHMTMADVPLAPPPPPCPPVGAAVPASRAP